jgi:hypothetical protein
MTSLLAKFSCRLSQKWERRNELGMDQALFQRQLHTALKQHVDYPQVVQEVAEQLQDHFSDPERLKFVMAFAYRVFAMKTEHIDQEIRLSLLIPQIPGFLVVDQYRF